ncbi:hypothetical protein [Microbacterium sp. CIAB417]|uniref:hypothetical protein n=1 Tax=Microbacterium sp. CIAB417 TaxID=2860287 RepID=UPI001FAB3D7E|nr:hypothetical protein [Microbacterium sp. CIAB417]
MTHDTERELASADPLAGRADDALAPLLHGMISDARAASTDAPASRRRWWRRRRILLPFGLAGAAILTGAVWLLPLGLSVNGTPVDLDVVIPITYTTDTGITVSCRYGIYFGEPENRTAVDERLVAFVKSHDWSGIGQRIYDQAVAHPFVPGPDSDLQVDTPEVRDSFSFSQAQDLIWQEIPAALREPGSSAGATSDCAGRLH